MSFAERQKHLLRTGEFSDFILTVDERDFKIHRSIVCPQSTVLHRLCAGNFKEGLEGRGTLPEASTDIFEKVLEFVYTGEYDPSTTEDQNVAGDDTSAGDETAAGDDAAAGDDTDSVSNQGAPESDEDETASLRQQSKQLMEHTEVYLLAKYLDISELMRHATSRFIGVAKKNFRADAFVEPFSRVFNHGGDGDSGLRAQILELCLENSEHLPPDGELTLLLLQHEPIAWKMLSRQAHEHACQVEELAKTQLALEETLQTSQDTIETLGQSVEEMTLDRDRILTLLEKYDRCRNCEKDFGSYVDKHERGIMRCKGCRCRHYT
ncbi:uncharacterized protein PV07_09674 [Cladophialophora immunda]|uniref:BTB domain-containing protein n=1 Tax=Cladophialophora immunda TaxID=569365 RepID=A0A0D2ANC3_9EURO|nr:uncharacterized protein PV07_09674 [Cladophialophora immunda]KIW26592.1 hypothetical protein PV07_09674 [Cladophialophora immunda]OQV02468.1 BTB/POZ domain-containing protein [Cladophialophora immunda]